jgi:hypothetical protein
VSDAVAPTQATSPELYLYGVVATGALRGLDADGIAGAAVDRVECGRLTALVSPVSSAELRFKRRDLQRHLGVLESAFAQTAILPYAFGTVAPSREAVEELLGGADGERLGKALARLDGHVQLNVKATYVEAEVLGEIVRADPEAQRLRDSVRQLGAAGHYEQIRLGERVAAAMEAVRQRDADRLAAALEGLAAEVVYDEAGDLTALKASLLVRRDRLARVERQLESLARDESPRLVLEAVGPLPPTAFASTYAAG